MECFSEREEIYRDRVERFIGFLKKIDPHWIKKRSWFEDLQAFELGENFFNKVLYADDGHTEDKGNFYTGILVYATINLEKKVGKGNDYVEAGFTIEQDINDDTEEEHESILGYIWWRTMYKIATKANLFSSEEIVELEKKRKEFTRRINRIGSLS